MVRGRALEAGKLLAAVLLSRPVGSRPVTLLGYSMGAKASDFLFFIAFPLSPSLPLYFFSCVFFPLAPLVCDIQMQYIFAERLHGLLLLLSDFFFFSSILIAFLCSCLVDLL